MNEQECLSRMVPPSQKRPGKPLGGVIQIMVGRACDKHCFDCTQGSNLGGRAPFMTLENFQRACSSLKDYFGVVGVFGGNPAMHPAFKEICNILKGYIPFERRGIWCNNPMSAENADVMRKTFNPRVSNLNVHLDPVAYRLFRSYWPEAMPFGLTGDSRHSPPFVSMVDIGIEESERYELISRCPINQHWSALIGEFRGELRAWFCEIAGAQAMLHQWEPDYPDTGMPIKKYYTDDGVHPINMTLGYNLEWWQLPMVNFYGQVRQHCHNCSIPLNGYGELAQSTSLESKEQVSTVHESVYKLKDRRRSLELVTDRAQLQEGRIQSMVKYLQNASV